jgi:hypothetical protein
MLLKKSKFYTLENILKKNCIYNLIIGERSNGKTYSTLKHCLTEYCEHGGQFAIVRRWKEDIRGRRASDIFSSIVDNGEVEKLTKGQYTTIHYYAGKFYLANYLNNKVVYEDDNIVAYTFALSDTEHNKSISYPKIKNIVFDEFLTKHLYLQLVQ